MAQLVKTEDGLAIASAKTVMGLAIASVKTIDDLDNTASAGCNTERFNNNGSYDDLENFGFYTWLANRFTAGATFTACKAIIRMDVNGTPPAGTLQAKIYTVGGGGSPNAIVGTASATVNRALLSSGVVQVEFDTMSASLTNATDYFVVVQASSTDGGGTNAARWVKTTDATKTMYGSTDGSSWDFLGNGILNAKLNSV